MEMENDRENERVRKWENVEENILKEKIEQ